MNRSPLQNFPLVASDAWRKVLGWLPILLIMLGIGFNQAIQISNFIEALASTGRLSAPCPKSPNFSARPLLPSAFSPRL